MDPFDEFEFRPLTEGLGFHKKSLSLKEGLQSSGVIDEELKGIPSSVPKSIMEEIPQAPTKKHSFEDVLSALEKTPLNRPNDLKFTEPLPREKKKALELDIPAPVQSPFPVPEAYKGPAAPIGPATILKTPSIADLASVGTRRGAADSPQSRKLTPVTMSVASAVLDLIICTALGLLFLVVLLVITKTNLNVVMANLNKDYMVQIALGVMFLTVMQMYVVVARSFFGATLGEWTFDLQIGKDNEQFTEMYALKVALRSVLNLITGMVFLPLVSAILGRDIAGQLSGVKLYRQQI
jgi:hypothetical protein